MNHHSVRGGDKRARILESALKVFASKGFYAAKVADVAAEAGVADGTIYLYFKSKDDLLISLFEEQMQQVNSQLTTALVGAISATDKLQRFFKAYLGMVETHRHATEIITIELRQSAKFMKDYANPRFAEFLKLLAGIIDEGQASGTFVSGTPPTVLARAIFGLLDELALMWVTTKGDKIDIRKAADWVGRLVLEGLERRSA
ncbi:MAG: TetR/AcrR family transcriptional regulator [Deltaproteobacteria bacterium]|nr:TetR/AcrR family transcriptional regulator [Deltaproteobacteria bacterium]